FDLDSTLIEIEGLDELAREAGCYDAVAQITESAMRGELDFTASFTKRVALLRGLPRSAVAQVMARLKLTPGADFLFQFFRSKGIESAILSGGFDFFAEPVASRLGAGTVVCNRLQWDGELASGAPVLPIVGAERKASALRDLRDQLSVSFHATIGVGDGANDIPLIREAGAGIAFHAKPKVREAAPLALDRRDLRLLLLLLGFDWNEISEFSFEPIA
ncbi:MAG: phosphoserine phosphatase SerB, partial [Proteobacteria bacterium]